MGFNSGFKGLTITERCILPTQCSYAFRLIPETAGISPFFIFKGIYYTDSVYSVYKDKLQNYSCNQFEEIFTLWYKWN